MGVVTPNMGIYIPSAGETNYDAPFSSGMVNVDQHDHTGGPNKGVPIGTGGIADGSVTFAKLNLPASASRQMLQSGSGITPAWSTSTWPATTTVNQILYSSSNNVVGEIPSANNGVLTTNGSGVPSIDVTNFHVLTTGVQMKGNNTNTAPPSGFIGEQIRSFIDSSSAVSISMPNTPQDITSISLTAGIWDISCVAVLNLNGATVTNSIVSINTTSATLGDEGDNYVFMFIGAAGVSDGCGSIANWRLLVSGTQTVYMVMQAAFTVANPKGYGRLSATRVG